MTKLLVLGVCPLPFESSTRTFGPGTRTWQLVEPLLDDGHQVTLVALRIPGTYPADTPPVLLREDGRLTYVSALNEVYSTTDLIREKYRETRPDAVVFAHGGASYFDQALDADVPTWIDLCGHVMAEAQAKASVYADDCYVDYFFDRYVGALSRGDRFSTVSEAQKFALIGELGLAGRLNAETDGVDFVSVIPCGAEEEDYVFKRAMFRGIDVDEDAFVVLWSGGFNTWTDVDTMFAGLEYAMKRDPSVYFVATGGQIDGHDEKTYPRFVNFVENSEFRDRFVLKGWIDRQDVPNTYFEADVGINCEKDIYEVRLGSKHRILDWSRAALPAVSTRVTELSVAIEEDGVGFVCPPGDSERLGRTILEAVERRDELEEMGERCRHALRKRYGFRTSTAALRKWAEHPTHAPDRDRAPLCLQRLVAASHSSPPADTKGTETDSMPSEEEDYGSEGRWAWFRRVVGKSYQDGGIRMVIWRALGRMLRLKATD